MAMCIWALEDHDLADVLFDNKELDVKRWIFLLMDVLPHTLISPKSWSPFALWEIWRSRRKAVHEQIFQTPHATHHFVKSYIRELEACRPKKLTGHPVVAITTLLIKVLLKSKLMGVVSHNSNEGSYSAVAGMTRGRI